MATVSSVPGSMVENFVLAIGSIDQLFTVQQRLIPDFMNSDAKYICPRSIPEEALSAWSSTRITLATAVQYVFASLP